MFARHLPVVAAIALAAFGSAPARAAEPAGRNEAWSQSGLATWYGGRHAGRRTSSGETFDPALMTAAHASLPLGSYVRVTVEESGSSIIVRVNDREPAYRARCIDLSQGAAARLGIVSQGRARVTLAAVSADEVAADSTTELAEAPDDAVNGADTSRSIAPRGRQHRHHAAR